MRRREFIKLIAGSSAAYPFTIAAAQPADRMARIGFFTPQSPNPPWIAAFRSGLREHGYIEGHNVVVELRSADGKKENYPQMMAELFAFKPDVVMTWSTPTSVALKQATSTIPIVSISGDPVGLRLAESLAHPGGNLTGFAIFSIDVEAKQLQLLKDTLSRLSSVAVLSNPTNPVNQPIVDSIRRKATADFIGRQCRPASRGLRHCSHAAVRRAPNTTGRSVRS